MKDLKKLAIFGYGGHAREVAAQIGKPVTFFVDDNRLTGNTAHNISTFDPTTHMMLVAVADPTDREKIVNRLPKNTQYFTFIHQTALILEPSMVSIGVGSFIGAYSIITTDIQIGKHAILNRACHIGHDTRIGDFFSAMPGAIVSGNCTIGDRVYLGTNSSVKERIRIDDGLILGMNSCLTINPAIPNGVYGGVPAKLLKLK